MDRTFGALTLLTMVGIPAGLFAKGATGRITIKGADLITPIEITDPKILTNFCAWTGPGTSSSEPQGLIVDWSRGVVAEPPKGLQRCEVSFYTKALNTRPVYVVLYGYDASSEQGYVYLPGRSEEWYRLNVKTIFRGIEGNWFRAWTVWDKVARPLIARAKTVDANRSIIGSVSTFRE